MKHVTYFSLFAITLLLFSAVHSKESAEESDPDAQNMETQSRLDFFVCYLICKNYLVQNNKVIMANIGGPTQADIYLKMVGRSMIDCVEHIPKEITKKIMDQLKDRKSLKELQLSQFSNLANISLPFYKSLTQHHHVDITKEEQIYFNLTKDFEREIIKRTEKNKQETEYAEINEDTLWGAYIAPEMKKLAGIDFSSFSSTFKVSYIGIILFAVAFLFFLGYRTLFGGKGKASGKKTKVEGEKKQSASPAKQSGKKE